jgi:hypothetical protein
MRNPTCKKDDRKSSHGFLYSGSLPILPIISLRIDFSSIKLRFVTCKSCNLSHGCCRCSRTCWKPFLQSLFKIVSKALTASISVSKRRLHLFLFSLEGTDKNHMGRCRNYRGDATVLMPSECKKVEHQNPLAIRSFHGLR